MISLLFIIGTRPEAIKMAPLILAAKKHPNRFNPIVCVTEQHTTMLKQVLDFFNITPDYHLNIMTPNQSLSDITTKTMTSLESVFNKVNPNIVLVQGDTNTSFSGALAAFYNTIPIAHIEAGLRSFNKQIPFPEEANRCMISQLASHHFTPTTAASTNLKNDGITTNVHMVGNTVIDALLHTKNLITKSPPPLPFDIKNLDQKKLILLTCHRREHWGAPMDDIFSSILSILKANPDAHIIFPVHLNPKVQKQANQHFNHHPQVTLTAPLSYPKLVYVMLKSHLILTDSGGIQEEAPSLGKPVLVLRNVTERMEGIEAGTAELVGTTKHQIIESTQKLLHDDHLYQSMAKTKNPYGDGESSERILNILKGFSL